MLGLAIACVVSAAAWVYLLAAHGGYWLTSQRLPAGKPPANPPASPPAKPAGKPVGEPAGQQPPAGGWPDVVAVVPARNEADMLPVTLPALLGQDYPGDFRVIVVDDGSDDGTGEVAAELGDKSLRDGGAPLTVLAGQPRPAGWAGKVWAMSQGLTAAEAAQARYVLFTDADISWAPGALRDLVAAAERDDRALLSQMALLRAETAWERVIVPAFVYFFAQLYPFRRVNDPASRTAAGAGGCMLIRKTALDKGLEPIRGALIDDVALATLVKRGGNRCWLGLATDIRSARPYPRLASLWHMVARSAYTQLRYSPLLLAGTIVGLLLLYAAPPAGAITWLITAAATPAAVLAGAAGPGRLGTDVGQLPAHAPPLRAVAAARAGAPADRAPVRGDDRRLGAPPLLRPRGLLAPPASRVRLTGQYALDWLLKHRRPLE